jgi:hypothetical protein
MRGGRLRSKTQHRWLLERAGGRLRSALDADSQLERTRCERTRVANPNFADDRDTRVFDREVDCGHVGQFDRQLCPRFDSFRQVGRHAASPCISQSRRRSVQDQVHDESRQRLAEAHALRCCAAAWVCVGRCACTAHRSPVMPVFFPVSSAPSGADAVVAACVHQSNDLLAGAQEPLRGRSRRARGLGEVRQGAAGPSANRIGTRV